MSLPTYQRIPSDESTFKETGLSKRTISSHKVIRLLVLSTIVLTMMYGIQRVSRTLPMFFEGCYKGGLHSKGFHSGRIELPSHYTLPSGDKIPSVALGNPAVLVFISYCLLTRQKGSGRRGRMKLDLLCRWNISQRCALFDRLTDIADCLESWLSTYWWSLGIWGMPKTSSLFQRIDWWKYVNRTRPKSVRRSKLAGSHGKIYGWLRKYACFWTGNFGKHIDRRPLIALEHVPRAREHRTCPWRKFGAPSNGLPWSLPDPLVTDFIATVGILAECYSTSRPVAQNADSSLNEELTANPYPTWQKLEEMVEKGKIRNIGISKWASSNYGQTDSDIIQVSTYEGTIIPPF